MKRLMSLVLAGHLDRSSRCWKFLKIGNYLFGFNLLTTNYFEHNALIDLGLMPFSTIGQSYHGGSLTHIFPGFLTPVLHTTYFPSNWLLFQIARHASNTCVFIYQHSETSGYLTIVNVSHYLT